MPDTTAAAQATAQIWSIQVSDSCVVCGACVPVCPTDALTLEDNNVDVRLRITPEDCIHCEACINTCVMDALHFDWGNPEPCIAAASAWVHCKGCGEAIATRAELDLVRARLQAEFPPAFLEFTENYCPACKYRQAGMPKGH